MATTTLRPTANGSIGSGWTVVGGAGSHYASQADEVDGNHSSLAKSSGASWVQFTPGLAINPDQRIASCRIRLRAKGAGSATDLRAKFRSATTGVLGPEDRWTSCSSSAWTALNGAWRTTHPSGVEWTTDLIYYTEVYERNLSTSTTAHLITALYFDVDVRTRMVADVTGPAGTVVDTTQPNVLVGYTDTDAAAPTAMLVAVFSAAVYGAGGFHPYTDLADAAWSYDGAYSPTVQVGAALTNGVTYRAYAAVGKDFNGATWYSEVDYSEFTIDVDPPTAPSITTTYDEATHDVEIEITAAAPPPASTAYSLTVEYDDGEGFTVLPGGLVGLPVAGPFTATVTHRAASRGVEVTYRVTATATVSGLPLTSPPDTDALTIALDKRWILRSVAPDGTGLDLVDAPVVAAPSAQLEESAGVFRPLGRRNAVVVSAGVHGEDGALMIAARSGWDAARELLRSTDPVFCADPFGGNRFIRLTSRAWSVLGTLAGPRRPVALDYVEVDAPVGSVAVLAPTVPTTGMDLWVEADSLGLADAAAMSSWADLSAANQDFSAAGTARPTYRATGGPAGLPAAEFDGGTDVMTSAASAATKPFTIVAVVKCTDVAGGRTILGSSVTGGVCYREVAGPLVRLTKQGTSEIGAGTTAPTMAAWQIIAVTYSSTGVWAHYLGSVGANGTGTTDTTFTASTVRLGLGTAAEFFLGRMYAVLRYSRVLSADELNELCGDYLAVKTGLTWTAL